MIDELCFHRRNHAHDDQKVYQVSQFLYDLVPGPYIQEEAIIIFSAEPLVYDDLIILLVTLKLFILSMLMMFSHLW